MCVSVCVNVGGCVNTERKYYYDIIIHKDTFFVPCCPFCHCVPNITDIALYGVNMYVLKHHHVMNLIYLEWMQGHAYDIFLIQVISINISVFLINQIQT